MLDADDLVISQGNPDRLIAVEGVKTVCQSIRGSSLPIATMKGMPAPLSPWYRSAFFLSSFLIAFTPGLMVTGLEKSAVTMLRGTSKPETRGPEDRITNVAINIMLTARELGEFATDNRLDLLRRNVL